MKLEYQGQREESSFILTDFNCSPAQQILQDKGYFKILWNRKNNCQISIDGYTISLEENQVMFSTPLNIIDIPLDSHIISIVFNREFYCLRDHDHEVSCQGLLFFGSSLPPIITLNKEEVKSFEATFQILKEELDTKDDIQGEMLRVMLKRLLIKSTRLVSEEFISQSISKSQLDMVRKFHVLVESHFREKHQVSDYAELLYKSPKTLSNLFKKSGNKSPLSIINERIVLEAKRLLLFSNKSADQIAYELGYKEAAHFSKFFKSHAGMPPMQFKDNHQKQKKATN